jgi:hypothetical protein
MKLEIVTLLEKRVVDDIISLRQCGVERDWMDNTLKSYAYRCLPLNIANQYGWAVYPKKRIVAFWDGSEKPDCIKFIENPDNLAASWFGHGILTFGVPFLIKLDKGYNLYITGAPNHHMKGVQPCSGIYEADWAPYTFTMNWRFMQSNYPVVFTEKDPICFFFPIKQDLIENIDVKYSTLEDQDEHFVAMLQQFHKERDEFNKTNKEFGWQKTYFKGLYPDGKSCPYDHKTKIKTKPIK